MEAYGQALWSLMRHRIGTRGEDYRSLGTTGEAGGQIGLHCCEAAERNKTPGNKAWLYLQEPKPWSGHSWPFLNEMPWRCLKCVKCRKFSRRVVTGFTNFSLQLQEEK